MSYTWACEGYGQKPAEIMFVGISAGKLGALKTRVPFTKDASGRLFQRVLFRLGLSRTPDETSHSPDLFQCYVTNLVKGRVLDPFGNNRLPTQEEVDFWWPELEKEINAVNPRLIIALSALVHKALSDHNCFSLWLKHPRWYASHGALKKGSKGFKRMIRDYSKAVDFYIAHQLAFDGIP